MKYRKKNALKNKWIKNTQSKRLKSTIDERDIQTEK